MTALAKDRVTRTREARRASYPVAATTKIYAGSIVAINTSGYAVPGAATNTLKVVGMALEQADNSSGGAAAINVEVETGVAFRFGNSSSSDEITTADVGDSAYVVDDQTVAKTSNTGARPVAGIIVGVDSTGVWVLLGSNYARGAGLVAASNLSDVGAVATARGNLALNGAGTAGAPNGTGVTATDQAGAVYRTTITLAGTQITMTDATTAGCHGALKVYDFPAGVINVLGATTDLAITAAANIGATAAVVGSIGSATVGTDNATLTSTEADIVASTAATLTGSAGTMKGKTTAVAVFDGSSTALDAYLNFAVPDAGSTGNSSLTVTGTVTIVWVNLGDN